MTRFRDESPDKFIPDITYLSPTITPLSIKIPTKVIEFSDFSKIYLGKFIEKGKAIEEIVKIHKYRWSIPMDGRGYTNGWARFHYGDIVLHESTHLVIFYRPELLRIVIAGYYGSTPELDGDIGRLDVLINVTEDKYVRNVEFYPSEFNMSRTGMAILFTEEGIPLKFPEIYKLVDEYVVLGPLNNELKWRELQEMEKPIPVVSLFSKANVRPKELVFWDIERLLRCRYYKSQVIRRLALRALHSAHKEAGWFDTGIMKVIESEFIQEDITEDLKFIERVLRSDNKFINDSFQILYKRDVNICDIKRVEVKYFRQGWNKQIYITDFFLRNGDEFQIAISTIKHDEFSGGYSAATIDKSLKLWQELSAIGAPCALLGMAKWHYDWRPKQIENPKGSGECYFENNILVTSRHFIPGVSLGEKLQQQSSPVEREIAIFEAIKSYILMWYMSKDANGKGTILSDPKPANIVLPEKPHDYKYGAIPIDMDALMDEKTLNHLLKLLSGYDEYPAEIIAKATQEVLGDKAVVGIG